MLQLWLWLMRTKMMIVYNGWRYKKVNNRKEINSIHCMRVIIFAFYEADIFDEKCSMGQTLFCSPRAWRVCISNGEKKILFFFSVFLLAPGSRMNGTWLVLCNTTMKEMRSEIENSYVYQCVSWRVWMWINFRILSSQRFWKWINYRILSFSTF